MAASKADTKLPEDLSLKPEQQKKFNKEIENVKAKGTDGPGVVYVGHIPHGFFEPQMSKYFRQFGRINKLRMSRSKKSGRSKGYAFIEFASHAVAVIVAESMNNYLMFHRLLKCKLMEEDKIHPDLFKNWRRHFKRPRGHLNNKERHNRPQTASALQKSTKRMQVKNRKTINKLKALGVTLDLPEPWVCRDRTFSDVGKDDDDGDAPVKRRKLTHSSPSNKPDTTPNNKQASPVDEVKGNNNKSQKKSRNRGRKNRSMKQNITEKMQTEEKVDSTSSSKLDEEHANASGGKKRKNQGSASAEKRTRPDTQVQQEKSPGKKAKSPEKFKKSATPKANTPEIATPKSATPKISTPKSATPKIATPKGATPKIATPKGATPKIATPKGATPKIATPNVATPKIATPKSATPKSGVKRRTPKK